MAARRRHPRWQAALLACGCAALMAPPACVIGPDQDPGCHADADCDPGFTCRAGACFRVTTSRSPPGEPADAGADVDATP